MGGWANSAGIFAVAASVLLSGCGRHGKEAPQGGSTVTPSQTKLKRNVELGQVTREALQTYVETVGYLEAEGQTEIAAGVSGVVDEVLFREGQVVDQNTVLVKVDQRRYVTALDVAKANEVRAEAALGLSREMERFSRLAGVGSSAEDKVKMTGQARVAEAELVAARSARQLAEHNLYRSQVRAPYAGQINQRRITPGTFLEDKTVIATMADLSRLRLVGYIPEKAAPLVRQMLQQENVMHTSWLVGSWFGNPVTGLAATILDHTGEGPAAFRLEFELRPFPRRTFYGRIFYLSTVASPDTHMFECKAEVPGRSPEGELRPGYTARIRCPLPGHGESMVVPEEAVRATEQGDIVFRPRAVRGPDGTVEWVAEAVTLQLGIRRPGSVEVLKMIDKNEAARESRILHGLSKGDKEGAAEVLKGLSAGDWIVRKGAESLENGTPIQIPEGQVQELMKAQAPRVTE